MTRHWIFPLGPSAGIVIAFSVVAPICTNAEVGYVMVQVTDMNHRPLAGVEIEIEGYGGTATTGNDGKARIPVGHSAAPGDTITFALINPSKGRQLAIFSPWDRRDHIPRFEDKPDNYVSIMAITVGERQALENKTFLRAATLKVSDASARQSTAVQNQSISPRYVTDASGHKHLDGAEIVKESGERNANLPAPLNQVAKEYGFAPSELGRAIRSLGNVSESTFDSGIVAYYERDFLTASRKLNQSLRLAEEEPTRTYPDTSEQQHRIAESAFFLGSSLFELGRYRDAANAYKVYLRIRPNDPYVIDSVARSYQEATDYREAKEYSDLAEAVARKIYKPDDPRLASALDSSGLIALLGGDAAKAEKLLYEAIDIDKRFSPEGSHNLAATYNNLGIALQNQQQYREAESAFRDAIAMDDRLLGPNNLESARYRNNLAMLWDETGQYSRAEQKFRELLALRERQQGPDHPQVGTTLANLSHALVGQEKFEEAKTYALRALAVESNAYGEISLQVAADLYALGQIEIFLKDYHHAEEHFQKALKIRELLEGAKSLDCGITLDKLADMSWRLDKPGEAERQIKEALAILQDRLAPNHPLLATCWEMAGFIFGDEHKFPEAVDALKKALAISTDGLGMSHHTTKRIKLELMEAEAGRPPSRIELERE